jgi:ATP-dependent helicase/nuclease subunit A
MTTNRFPHTLIRASAGTGKTFQLSNRYLGLAAAGVLPEAVLATTFTRKAAGEILDRVLTRLAQAANQADQAAELGGFIGDSRFDCDRAQRALEGLVQHLHRLRISTLDAFFAQIARSFDLELGLPPGWRIIEESADARLRGEAIQAVLTAGEERATLNLLRLLSKGEATRSISEQLRGLVNRLYDLYRETTEEAWNSIERPPRLSDDKLEAALQALAEHPLSDSRFVRARDNELAAARVGNWNRFIEKGLAGCVLAGETKYYGKSIDDALSEIYRALLRHAKGVLVGQLADQTQATWRFLKEFDVQYGRLKYARRALRFDDITLALGKSALVERVRQLTFRLDARLAHVLFDEFQDTSLGQWNVLCPLVDEVMLADGAAKSFFCVGDVKQAIYGWRGGVAELIEAVGTAWPRLDQPSLACSRRSAPPVIDTVNRVFSQLDRNPALAGAAAATAAWRRDYELHTTAKQELSGYARMITAPLADLPKEQKHVTLQFAAKEIGRIVRSSPGRSVGVLVRSNEAIAALIHQLQRDGVSASEEGGNPLTDSPAVLTVLSLLALADHPGDTAARFHVAHSPLGATVGLSNHEDAGQAARVSLHVREQLLSRGYGPTLYRWARDLAQECGPRDASRLLQLVELAYRYEPEAGLRTRDFVAYVESQRVEAPSPADVRVMTIHKSKGLEFDIVVLPQLDMKLCGQAPPVLIGRPAPVAAATLVCRYPNQGLRAMLPDTVRAAYDTHTEQETRAALCVLYVALTRAVHALHIIVAPSQLKEKKLPATLSGLLRGALTDANLLPAEAVVYEHGDRGWQGGVAMEERPGIDAEENWPQTSAFEIALAPAGKHRRRGLERESPSQLARSGQIDLAARMQLDGGRAVNRGSVFHAWFEQIEWLDGNEPDDAALRTIGLQLGASSTELEEWLTQFRAKLQNPRLRATLTRDLYLRGAPWANRPGICSDLANASPSIEVFRERPFAVRLGDTLLSGTFDRLVLIRNEAGGYDAAPREGSNRSSRPTSTAVKEKTAALAPAPAATLIAAEVLDYKTDAVPADDPQAIGGMVARYRPQLSAYRRAVSSIYGLPPDRVLTRLVLIEVDQVVEL